MNLEGRLFSLVCRGVARIGHARNMRAGWYRMSVSMIDGRTDANHDNKKFDEAEFSLTVKLPVLLPPVLERNDEPWPL